MFKINNVSILNFLSVGNVTQTVNFPLNEIALVMGINNDSAEGTSNGVGKAQPLYSKIRTPNGWVTFADVTVGTKVLTPEGKTTVVTGYYPQGQKNIYKVVFGDGRSALACSEHLWEVYDKENKKLIISTSEIQERLKKEKLRIDFIKFTEDYPVALPVHPYVLGLFLSKGIIENNKIIIPRPLKSVVYELEKILFEHYDVIESDRGVLLQPKYSDYIIEYFLKNNLVSTKKIPDIYMSSSFEQRKLLLMGIFDIQGEMGEKNTVQLVDDMGKNLLYSHIQQLVWSLGGAAYLKYKAKTSSDQQQYRDIILNILFKDNNDFFTSYEKQNFKVYDDFKLPIKSVSFNSFEEAACIKVADKNHLYITDNYVVTHNTTFINAITYALYGEPISKIRKPLLVNSVNNKNMKVTVECESNGKIFRITRGRKPDTLELKFKSEDGDYTDADSEYIETNFALGSSANTQDIIDKLIGMSFELFTTIVAMNTEVQPFMLQPIGYQRDIIEELFGASRLTEKAKRISDEMKGTKRDIEDEELRLATIKTSNNKIQESISALEIKSGTWDNTHNTTISQYSDMIKKLEDLDIETELRLHEENKELLLKQQQKNNIIVEKNSFTNNLNNATQYAIKLTKQLTDLNENICPTCKQGVDSRNHNELKESLKAEAKTYMDVITQCQTKVKEYDDKILSLGDPVLHSTFYSDVNQAVEHKSKIEALKTALEKTMIESNPYLEQIEELEKTSLQDIDYTILQEKEKLYKHQKLLFDLLSKRDSFIRKRIIDKSLKFLNNRLNIYLDKLELPHIVEFDSDLTFNIRHLGREFDYGSLSRGEKNRLTLGLNWAFRDCYEQLNGSLYNLYVDEILDWGTDRIGAYNALSQLKNFVRERGLNIMVITHKTELIEYVEKRLEVRKENGFTDYSWAE